MDVNSLIHSVNAIPNANVFMASMMPFIAHYQSHPFIRKMLMDGMDVFFTIHILPFEGVNDIKVNFVGSVAHYFKGFLIEICHKNQISLGSVIQKPTRGIVDYFMRFGIPNHR